MSTLAEFGGQIAYDPGMEGADRSAPDGSDWHRGIRRTGELLELRDRWQGFVGPNAWLTIPLFGVAVLSFRDGVTRYVCDPTDREELQFGESSIDVATCDSMVTRLRGVDELLLSSVWIAVAATVALLFVGLRFHPVVQFGPETIRWRNWFRWKEVPTPLIARLGIESYNWRAWVPVVTAEMKSPSAGRSRPFVATLSFRRRSAEHVSAAVTAWAAEQSIPARLPAEQMIWRIRSPANQVTAATDI